MQRGEVESLFSRLEQLENLVMSFEMEANYRQLVEN